ncbi:glycosyltransferase family 2 protein [Patescibacteria group bacterium]
MTLSIIYINYNTRGLLKQSLKHLYLMRPALDFEVIVVDNNSSDGSIEMLKERFKGVRVLNAGENAGYAKGANLGLREAKGNNVAIFNADIFISRGSLESIINYLDNHMDVAMVGPKLINPDKSLQYSCYKFPKLYTPILRRSFLGNTVFGKNEIKRYLMQNYNHNEAKEVDWLLGGALVARKKVLEEVGFFDERFFLYFEDTDLGQKLKNKGYKVIYLPSAVMHHLHRRESADTGILKSLFNKTTRIHIVSALKYFWKHKSRNT